MESDIAIAVFALHELVARLPAMPDIEDVQPIEDAARTISDLRGRQWREMVREPFTFPIHKETSAPKGRANDGISLDDLGL